METIIKQARKGRQAGVASFVPMEGREGGEGCLHNSYSMIDPFSLTHRQFRVLSGPPGIHGVKQCLDELDHGPFPFVLATCLLPIAGMKVLTQVHTTIFNMPEHLLEGGDLYIMCHGLWMMDDDDHGGS